MHKFLAPFQISANRNTISMGWIPANQWLQGA